MMISSHAVAAVPPHIQPLIEAGEFDKAQEQLRAAATAPGVAEADARGLLYEAERLDRIRKDFTITEPELYAQIREQIPDLAPEEIRVWREAGWLEGRMVDGRRRYFKNTVRNLFRLSAEARARRLPQAEPTPGAKPSGDREVSMEERMATYLAERRTADSVHVAPRRFLINYALTVDADAVPAGETVRCWLPFPREVPSQQDIALVSSDPAGAFIAPNDALQRSAYLERTAVAGQPTRFEIAFTLTTRARVEIVDPAIVQPYDTASELYRTYTAEEPPHLEFTPRLRALAREIVGDETNPYLKARRIYGYIDGNIRYTSALEYSTIPNISEYCAENGRGDCGIQGLLFIALCRISGVPAKWQSGWSLLPERTTMHDWTEFYVEPYGWLPADPSRGCRPSDDELVRWFNFGNMDPYRLVVNDAYGTEFVPPKKHFRSETVDFQRGEVEWAGGNLYFDQWDWDIEVLQHQEDAPATAKE
ncbi:MAG: hypothetical protein PWP23_2918 [Candidatus Sumerlaeota bacterium]|nr:hypothetical protein [Candidatus Sumerlaeota bacterium]